MTSNQFAATAGNFNLSLPSQNLGVAVAFNGSAATVAGDTDANGSADVNFETNWAQLIAP